MTRADILALGVQTSTRFIKASDTGTMFLIPDGGDGGDAVAIVTSNPLAYTGVTVVENLIGITKAGFALIGAPNANTQHLITDASMGDYGSPVLGEWTADTASILATPAAGELRWNHATQTSATELYLDGLTASGIDMAALMLLVRDGDEILIQSGAANYQIWTISGTPTVSSGNWTLPVTAGSSAGTGATGFADAAALIVAVRPASTATVADDSITLAKMASGTAGNLITYDASGNPAAVTTGTATHVLTSNGVGLAPTFQAAAGGGGVTVQEEGTPLATVGDTLNFVGAALTASGTGTTKTITGPNQELNTNSDVMFDSVSFGASLANLQSWGDGSIEIINSGGSRTASIGVLGIRLTDGSNTALYSSSLHLGSNLGALNVGGSMEINNTTAGVLRDVMVRNVIQTPGIATVVTPASNGDLVMETTSNTSVTLKLKGSDGVVRSVVLTLA